MNLQTLLQTTSESQSINFEKLPKPKQKKHNNYDIKIDQQIKDDFKENKKLSKRILDAMKQYRRELVQDIFDYYKNKSTFSPSEVSSTCPRKSLLFRFKPLIKDLQYNLENEINYPQLDLVCKVGETVHDYFQKHLLENIYDELIDYEVEIPSISLENASNARYDGYCRYDNKYIIVDIKTTKPDMVNTVKREHILQLHYYYYVLTTDYNKQVDEIHILNVGRDLKEFKLFNITIKTDYINEIIGKIKTLQVHYKDRTLMSISEIPTEFTRWCDYCLFGEWCKSHKDKQNFSIKEEKQSSKIEILM